jgi:hypothetical protein
MSSSWVLIILNQLIEPTNFLFGLLGDDCVLVSTVILVYMKRSSAADSLTILRP